MFGDFGWLISGCVGWVGFICFGLVLIWVCFGFLVGCCLVCLFCGVLFLVFLVFICVISLWLWSCVFGCYAVCVLVIICYLVVLIVGLIWLFLWLGGVFLFLCFFCCGFVDVFGFAWFVILF